MANRGLDKQGSGEEITFEAHGLSLTVTKSAGADGAVLVMVDTETEPDGSDGGPGLRVQVNDGSVFEGKPFKPVDERECGVCGRNDVITEEDDVPRCSRHEFTRRSYEVEVRVLITIDGDDEAAYKVVDETLQRHWNQDHAADSKPGTPWHFTMLEECVVDVSTDEE